MPSHQGSRAGVIATLVKIVLDRTMAMPFGLVLALVLGATPKKPALGVHRAQLALLRPRGSMRCRRPPSSTR